MAIFILCPQCKGSGKVSSFLPFIKIKKCPACNGQGKIKSKRDLFKTT